MIYVINFQYKLPERAVVVNTTSRSFDWSKGLSPFYLGPIKLYGNYVSQSMENAWQYSKVYGHLDHVDEQNNPTDSYFKWAQSGWDSVRANRYPMGKGVKPLFSYWDGEKMDYVTARKKIYIPLYAEAVKKTFAFKKLQELYQQYPSLYLQDFDAHNMSHSIDKDYWKIWNNPEIKVGHAYVLAMLLEGIL